MREGGNGSWWLRLLPGCPILIQEEQEAEIPLLHLKWGYLNHLTTCFLMPSLAFTVSFPQKCHPGHIKKGFPYFFEISLRSACSCGDGLFSVEHGFVHQLLVQINCAYIAK